MTNPTQQHDGRQSTQNAAGSVHSIATTYTLSVQIVQSMAITHRVPARKVQAIARLVKKLSLTEDEADTVVAICADHNAQPNKIAKLMGKGYEPQQVLSLYEVRDSLGGGWSDDTPSLDQIALLDQTFSMEADTNSLTDLISEIEKGCSFVSLSSAVRIVCSTAKQYGFITAEATLDRIAIHRGEAVGYE